MKSITRYLLMEQSDLAHMTPRQQGIIVMCQRMANTGPLSQAWNPYSEGSPQFEQFDDGTWAIMLKELELYRDWLKGL